MTIQGNKFKAGDLIVGNESSQYNNYTAKGKMIYGRVREVLSETEMRIEIIAHVRPHEAGSVYRVRTSQFDLYTNDPFEAYLRGHITEKEYAERVANA